MPDQATVNALKFTTRELETLVFGDNTPEPATTSEVNLDGLTFRVVNEGARGIVSEVDDGWDTIYPRLTTEQMLAFGSSKRATAGERERLVTAGELATIEATRALGALPFVLMPMPKAPVEITDTPLDIPEPPTTELDVQAIRAAVLNVPKCLQYDFGKLDQPVGTLEERVSARRHGWGLLRRLFKPAAVDLADADSFIAELNAAAKLPVYEHTGLRAVETSISSLTAEERRLEYSDRWHVATPPVKTWTEIRQARRDGYRAERQWVRQHGDTGWDPADTPGFLRGRGGRRAYGFVDPAKA